MNNTEESDMTSRVSVRKRSSTGHGPHHDDDAHSDDDMQELLSASDYTIDASLSKQPKQSSVEISCSSTRIACIALTLLVGGLLLVLGTGQPGAY